MLKNLLKSLLKSRKSIAALPTLLVLGTAVVDIGIVVTAGVYFVNNSDYGVRLSAEALAAAKSGVQDALLHLVRDKTFLSESPYSLTVSEKSSASVIVCKNTTECGGTGKYKISSTGSAFTKRKKVEAVVIVDSTSGAVDLESLKEVPL
ncbi:MAG: hypothetical protein PHP03_01150 [Candidatus Pacebacteria bacterium]|nr:hypothetical protein [Candidatus Paceibacterota bacterium]